MSTIRRDMVLTEPAEGALMQTTNGTFWCRVSTATPRHKRGCTDTNKQQQISALVNEVRDCMRLSAAQETLQFHSRSEVRVIVGYHKSF